MNRKGTLAAAVMAVVFATALPAHAQTAPVPLQVSEVDVSGAPNVVATVTAPAGLTGRMLPPDAFHVVEAGHERKARVERLPDDSLEVMLVVDTSGSMQGAPIEGAKLAASAFLAKMPAATRIGVVGFGATPAVASPFTLDRGALVGAVQRLEARGETALYDALSMAIDQFSPGPATERAIVLLSDGGDTASATPIEAVADRLSAAHVHLDVAELLSTESNSAALGRLAAAGNGRVASAVDPAALAGIYDAIANSLSNRYRVTFLSTSRGRTDVVYRVAFDGVVAESVVKVPLPVPVPAGPAPAPTSPAEQPAARPDEGPIDAFLSSTAGLTTGAVACIASLLVAFVLMLDPQRRRARLSRLGRTVTNAARPSAIAGLAERATLVTGQMLERQGKRRSLNAALERAGVALRPEEFLVLVASLTFASGVVGWLMWGPAAGLMSVAFAVLVAVGALSFLTSKRKAKFADQLSDTLQLLAGSLRAGYGLLQAVDAVAREGDAPTREEFRRLVVETRLGRDLGDALDALAERVDSEDFAWVVQAIAIHREVGGDLAEVLDNVAGTIRERNQLKRQVKALSAEGRMSAYVLLALPLFIAVIVKRTNPEYFEVLLHGKGVYLLVLGGVLELVGAVWLKKLCKLVY